MLELTHLVSSLSDLFLTCFVIVSGIIINCAVWGSV